MNGNGSVAIIPSRFGSSRLPGKPLLQIEGRTLIEHVYRQVERVRGLGSIIVATDDDRIASTVSAFGGNAVITRSDHPSGTDRLAEASSGFPDDTIVVNVQGDEPMIEPEVVEQLLAAASLRDAEVVTAMTPLSDPARIADPANVKVVTDRNGFAMYFSRSPIPSSGRTFLHLGLYAYTARFLRTFQTLRPTPLEVAERLEQLRILENGFRLRVVEVESESWGIDTPADLRAFEDWLRTSVRPVHAMGRDKR
jgi:3-deoxy-manno-octulosonate cytidylyltransferase (CMP-KDO synthetase)